MADETIPDNQKYDGLRPGQILADSSVADFIGELGTSIAAAQQKLDTNSINQIAALLETETPIGQQSLLEMGFLPPFYHYQYADLACSLQLRLQVGKKYSLGIQAGFNYGNTKGKDFADNSSSSNSSNVNLGGNVQIGTLKFKIKGDPDDSVETDFGSNGTKQISSDKKDPKKKAAEIKSKLLADPDSPIALVVSEPPSPGSFTITPDPTIAMASRKLKTTQNSVAFLATDPSSDLSLIQIKDNQDTDFVFKTSGPTITQATVADLPTFATEATAKVEALAGYTARLVDLNTALDSIYFATGSHDLSTFTADGSVRNADTADRIKQIAGLVETLPASVKLSVIGYADRQHFDGRTDAESISLNKALSQARAKTVRDLLVANGLDAGRIVPATDASGDGTTAAQAHADNNSGASADDIDFRKTEIRVEGAQGYWIFVVGDVTKTQVLPDLTGTPSSTTNGFIAVVLGDDLTSLAGKTITLDGTDFTLSGTAVPDGPAANTPAAFATNLATAINDDDTVTFRASSTANVVTLFDNDDEFTLTLGSDGSAEITLKGKGKMRVQANFKKSSTTKKVNSSTSKSTMAFGASVDVRYARQFDLTVTGNSSIRARLVSVPAPPEFLSEISTYMASVGMNVPSSVGNLPTLPTGSNVPILDNDGVTINITNNDGDITGGATGGGG